MSLTPKDAVQLQYLATIEGRRSTASNSISQFNVGVSDVNANWERYKATFSDPADPVLGAAALEFGESNRSLADTSLPGLATSIIVIGEGSVNDAGDGFLGTTALTAQLLVAIATGLAIDPNTFTAAVEAEVATQTV